MSRSKKFAVLMVAVLFYTVLAACSDGAGNNTGIDASSTVETGYAGIETEVQLSSQNAEALADTYCRQQTQPQSTVGYVLSGFAAGNGLVGRCNDTGALNISNLDDVKTILFSDYCVAYDGGQTTYTGSIEFSTDGTRASFWVDELQIKNGQRHYRLDGDISITDGDAFALVLNMDITDLDSYKQLRLENVKASFQGFDFTAPLWDLLKDPASFGDDIRFVDTMNYSGRVYYSEFGYVDIRRENSKTIIVGADGVRLEWLNNGAIEIVKGETAEELATQCPPE